MIWGRNAALNVLVLVFKVDLNGEQIAALNVFGAAVVGVIANMSDPTTAPTFSLTTKAPLSGNVTNTET
jgi:hypothetical protein